LGSFSRSLSENFVMLRLEHLNDFMTN